MDIFIPSTISLITRAAIAQIRSRVCQNPQITALEKGIRLDPLQVTCREISLNTAHCTLYKKITRHHSDTTFPLLYPQVLAGPLMYWLMSDSRFGFGLLGIVHTKHQVKQFAPINEKSSYTITCMLHPIFLDANDKGWRFYLDTQLQDVSDHLLWQSRAEFFIRRPLGPKKQLKASSRKVPEIFSESLLQSHAFSTTLMATQENTRQYAYVSKDFNPIHMSSFLARQFGFKNSIAHGLWMMSTCANAIQESLTDRHLWLNEFQFDFVSPWYLPNNKKFLAAHSLANQGGDLICELGDDSSRELTARGSGKITELITS